MYCAVSGSLYVCARYRLFTSAKSLSTQQQLVLWRVDSDKHLNLSASRWTSAMKAMFIHRRGTSWWHLLANSHTNPRSAKSFFNCFLVQDILFYDNVSRLLW
jgi:hypothetical protein